LAHFGRFGRVLWPKQLRPFAPPLLHNCSISRLEQS
jgi:hypothetical protein